MCIPSNYNVTDETRGCEDGEVRLQGGVDPSNGHVEVCFDRRWGAICNNRWRANETRVVCSQLNFDPEGMNGYPYYTVLKRWCFTLDAIVIEGSTNDNNVEVFLGQVIYTGSEKYINECSYSAIPPTAGCTTVAVSCTKSSSEETN